METDVMFKTPQPFYLSTVSVVKMVFRYLVGARVVSNRSSTISPAGTGGFSTQEVYRRSGHLADTGHAG